VPFNEGVTNMIKSKRRNMRIALGVDMATVLEVTNTHILGMFDNPTFKDKPYFTIAYDPYDPGGYHHGHYDLNMIDAWNSLQERSS
jgi:hypothetical protein